MKPLPLIAAAVLALAAGCDARRTDAGNAAAPPAAEGAAAAGEAEEGRLSVDAPGMELSIDLPNAIRGELQSDEDSRILPPRARLVGMHIRGEGDGGGGSVEMRFTAAEPPER
ncbi:MAG: hypothetical protein M3N07_03165, partial [Pseudomonadota bacterium]|nr:hypothetical protein [Pseudomonadota bacterium]